MISKRHQNKIFTKTVNDRQNIGYRSPFLLLIKGPSHLCLIYPMERQTLSVLEALSSADNPTPVDTLDKKIPLIDITSYP